MAAPPILQEFLARPPEQRRLGAFHLHSQLGRGGFAPVWLAREVYDGIELRSVALKLFWFQGGEISGPIRRYREHVIREARALCQVEHPNIVRFYSLVIEDGLGLVALAMEYLPGRSLADRLSAGKRPELRETLEIGLAVASALEAAHGVGIVHRDIKPANVMRSADTYKLIDFGIAAADELESAASEPHERRAILEDLPLGAVGTKLSMAMTSGGAAKDAGTLRLAVAASGTVGYIDPVCVAGAAAVPASDLYSLGALLFECVSGVLPAVAAAGGTKLLGEVLDGRVGPPKLEELAPRTPVPLSELINHLLAPRRSERPASASEVARRLELVQAELGAGRTRQSSASLPNVEAPSNGDALPSLNTKAGRASEPATSRRPTRSLLFGAAAVSVVATIGLIAVRERANADNHAMTPSSAAPAAPAAATVSANARPADRVHARLVVSPANARVSVNGTARQILADGSVWLSGEPGSALLVKAELDGRVIEAQVVLRHDGRTEPVELRVPGPPPRQPLVRRTATRTAPSAPSGTPSSAPRVPEAPPAALVPKDEF